MTEASKGLITSKELGMAVADRLRQAEKQPKAPRSEHTDKQQPHLRRPLMPPPAKEQRVGREASHAVQHIKDELTTLEGQPPRHAADTADKPTPEIAEPTADPVKKPKIDEAFPMFSTPEQQAHYRKQQESPHPFTEEELKQWQARWDSPEGIAERKRLDEHMEQYKKPLTQEEWNKLLAPRLPKGWKRWDAQGREQRYQTPRDKDLIAYYNYIGSLSPLEVVTLWEMNQQRIKAGLPHQRYLETEQEFPTEEGLLYLLDALFTFVAPETEQEESEEEAA
jgi:hypothetical protein